MHTFFIIFALLLKLGMCDFHIHGDVMTFNKQKKIITVNGHVFAIKNPHEIIASDNAIITLNNQKKIETIKATGNVYIIHNNRMISGDSGFFNIMDKKGEITGNIRIIQGTQKNFIEGEMVSFDLGLNHYILKPKQNIKKNDSIMNKKTQIEAIIYPNPK
jgi:lipopolysaccharide transport protein LptA